MYEKEKSIALWLSKGDGRSIVMNRRGGHLKMFIETDDHPESDTL